MFRIPRLPACLTLLLFLFPEIASAQFIWGTVVDDSTGGPIAGAEIVVSTTRGVIARAASDATGTFKVSLPGAGAFGVVAQHIAYRTPEPSRVDVPKGQVVFVDLRLGRNAIPLQPLVVTAARDTRVAGFYERMNRGVAGRFIVKERIEQRPGARTSDLLAEVPGVELVRIGGGLRPRTNLIAMRSSGGPCNPTIYLDGLPIDQYQDSTVDDFIRPGTLEGVEIYTGGTTAPPPIEARGGCGVVAFWTRRFDADGRFSASRLILGGAALATLATMVLLTR